MTHVRTPIGPKECTTCLRLVINNKCDWTFAHALHGGDMGRERPVGKVDCTLFMKSRS